MLLGQRVVADRKKRGWTQAQLAVEYLAQFKVEGKAADAPSDTGARSWIAKLESGQLTEQVDDERRERLARALKLPPAGVATYRSLPLTKEQLDLVPDRPAETPFEELWVWSRRPREVSQPGYAHQMTQHWSRTPETWPVVVFFVPDETVAAAVLGAFEVALADHNDRKTILEKKLQIIITDIPRIVPHFVVAFRPGHSADSPNYEGLVEVVRDDGTREFAHLPPEQITDVFHELGNARRLGPDLRYRQPKKDDRGDSKFRRFEAP